MLGGGRHAPRRRISVTPPIANPATSRNGHSVNLAPTPAAQAPGRPYGVLGAFSGRYTVFGHAIEQGFGPVAPVAHVPANRGHPSRSRRRARVSAEARGTPSQARRLRSALASSLTCPPAGPYRWRRRRAGTAP